MASREQATESSPNARPTPTAAESSPATGLESPASRTYAMSLAGNDQQVEEEEVPALKASELTSSAAASPVRISPSPASAEDSAASDPPSSSSSPGSPMSLFGPEDGFWSRTSPDSSPAAPVSDAESAASFYGSIAEAGISLVAMPDEVIPSFVSAWAILTTAPWMAARKNGIVEAAQAAARVAVATSPGASSPPTTARSSQWSALSSAKSGFTTSRGECWTAVTSECPSDAAASSSLADVLEADVPPRFYLSPKAAAGILRRARKRGRELPPALAEALRALGSQPPDDGKRTTRTSLDLSSAGRQAAGEGTTTRPQAGSSKSSVPSMPSAEGPTTTEPAPAISSAEPSAATPDPVAPTLDSSPIPSPQAGSTPARTAPGEEPHLSATLKGSTGKQGRGDGPEVTYLPKPGGVRRLSPTECERLQGLPDGWTWTP